MIGKGKESKGSFRPRLTLTAREMERGFATSFDQIECCLIRSKARAAAEAVIFITSQAAMLS